MKPTTNQILARLIDNSNTFCEAREEATKWASIYITSELNKVDVKIATKTLRLLTSNATWNVAVRILPISKTLLQYGIWSGLQVPIEPSSDVIDNILLAAWIANPAHSINLVRLEDDIPLLSQAVNANLPSLDKTVTPVLNHCNQLVYTSQNGIKHEYLYPVQLAFELAGIPSPKNWEVWREPDGINVPFTAYVPHNEPLGSIRILYHDGEMALIISGDQLRVELIHLKRLESAALEGVNSLIATNTKKKERSIGHGRELTKAEFLAEIEDCI